MKKSGLAVSLLLLSTYVYSAENRVRSYSLPPVLEVQTSSACELNLGDWSNYSERQMDYEVEYVLITCVKLHPGVSSLRVYFVTDNEGWKLSDNQMQYLLDYTEKSIQEIKNGKFEKNILAAIEKRLDEEVSAGRISGDDGRQRYLMARLVVAKYLDYRLAFFMDFLAALNGVSPKD